MEIDGSLSLASSLHAGPRRYALLLGSGVSAAAGVPTGWDVVVDLVRRLAALQNEDPGSDPVSWYRESLGSDPDYSGILNALAPSPAERRDLLEGYFEATDEERAEGLKSPTRAHHAIAELAATGHLGVVVTTNFDRLPETAMTERGVNPQVVSSPAHAAGMTPLAHSKCTILKLHGDYLSPDLKNTVEELAEYPAEIQQLLDSILDHYGLVVCGWSGDWDRALREAILSAPNRRYSTYWAANGALGPAAQDIVNAREAVVLEISSADGLFEDLSEKVKVLGSMADQRPASTDVAVAQLKRYLPDESNRIRLHDLLGDEVEAFIAGIADLTVQGDDSPASVAARIQTYESAFARLAALISTAGFFATESRHDLLLSAQVDRIATRQIQHSGSKRLIDLQHYPATLALYALGLGSVAAGRLEPLAKALGEVTIPDRNNGSLPVGFQASSWITLDHNLLKEAFPELARKSFPQSIHLFAVMRPATLNIIRDDQRYRRAFDQLEFALGMTYADARGGGVGPTGLFAARTPFQQDLPAEAVERGAAAFLASGLFGGTLESLAAAQAEYVAESVQTVDR